MSQSRLGADDSARAAHEHVLMHVLVVEDEPKLGRLLERGLRQYGFSVQLATRGHAALAMAAVTRFDAVILDIVLPDMSGLETCHRLRARGVQAAIVLLTARDTIETRRAGVEAGADDYLVKPFGFHQLAARLRALHGQNARATSVPR